MQPAEAIELGRAAILAAITVGAPVLLVGMAVGLLIGLIQALTQIQDQTVSFVPKILAMVAVLSLLLPWMVQVMIDYSYLLISSIPERMIGH